MSTVHEITAGLRRESHHWKPVTGRALTYCAVKAQEIITHLEALHVASPSS